ncbi:MAG TPA: cupredoxin family protein [Burkholderiales bacterium]|nr:cupredoxin family protein [Burkholderiales bacterium]
MAFAAIAACDPASAAAAERADAVVEAKRKTSPAKGRSVERPYGREGDARRVKRVIKIDMSDTMRFFPDQIRVKRGETVRFALRNSGQMPHEMVIGTMDELKSKAALSKKNAETGVIEEHAVHVAPGATGRLVWQFTKAGEFHYACLVPGHFEAGMIGTIVVR